MTSAVPDNRFYLGDCLPVLAEMSAAYGEFADLVYMDPPFNSARLYKHAAAGGRRAMPQKAAFADTWKWTESAMREFREFTEEEAPGSAAAEFMTAMRGMLERRDPSTLAYLASMTRRIARVRAAMKPTASAYLHCDPTASHYLKLAMDAVFGRENFVMDVIWHRHNKIPDRRLPWRKYHDNILVYRNSPAAVIRNVLRDAGETVRRRRMKKTDGKIVNTDDFVEYEKREVLTTSVMRIADIAQGGGGEKTGYATQKPVALLRRIVESSSRPGDLVLDPFCGCGTTIAACHELGRRFVGVDVARAAAQATARRMRAQYPEFGELTIGDKTPASAREWSRLLPDADENAPEWTRFQYDAIAAIPEAEQTEGALRRTARQGAGGEVDGLIGLENPSGAPSSVVIQVKRKKRPDAADVADALLAVDNHGALMGLLITLRPPTAEMRERAEAEKRRFNGKNYPKVALLTYDEVKAGKFAEAIPREHAPDSEGGRKKRA